ncbi:MAG: NAD(P)-binding domain-containing protein [Chloroflexi bacterium]|nr:NAD(P)-binding domain-containing protein [Chloroflexota bacterium]
MNITICGAGNAAHTLIPLLASKGHAVTVYTALADEAVALREALSGGGEMTARFADGRVFKARPVRVTEDARDAASEADMVLLALPAFAHEAILRELAPHLPTNAWIVALPARGGFDWLVRAILPEHEGVVLGLQTLPWACRIQDWGRTVAVLGEKAVVDVAARPSEAGAEAARSLSELLGLPLQPLPNFLTLTLANTGQLIHPGIMYGLFRAWDGRPFGEDEVPLFYTDIDEETADILQAMSNEVQAVRAAIERARPELDLSRVATLHDWLLRAYADDIEDPSTLLSSFRTNRAYAGIRAPVELVEENAYAPWFASRYLAEDAPLGLVVTRGLADLVGARTPAIDMVILWAQEKLGKEYVRDGKLEGRDIRETRAPQRFGIHGIDDEMIDGG